MEDEIKLYNWIRCEWMWSKWKFNEWNVNVIGYLNNGWNSINDFGATLRFPTLR